jgi:hypothetical protein
VAVALATRKDVAATTTYDVPPPDSRVRPPALAGLYLEIDCGPVRARRTLAGIEPGSDPNLITQDQVEAVRAAMFGAYTLTVEAGAPSPSVQLDDALSMAISTVPLAAATDDDGRIAAFAKGLVARPRTLHVTSVPLEDADGPVTFETIFRMTLHRRVELPEPGGAMRLHTGVDILPQTVFATADPDPVAAFRATARRTARLAIAERTAFEDSTATRLSNARLVAAPGAIFDALPGVERARTGHRRLRQPVPDRRRDAHGRSRRVVH